MPDKFADLEEPKKRTLPAALLVLSLMSGFAIHQLSKPRQVQLSGVIESTGSSSEHVGPSVRLDNGLLITATASGSGPFVPGDHVIVFENIRLTSAPAYQIAGKDSSHRDLTIRSSRDRFAASVDFCIFSLGRGRKSVRLNSGVMCSSLLYG